jgi:subtilisin-like proprotein convertase family protein
MSSSPSIRLCLLRSFAGALAALPLFAFGCDSGSLGTEELDSTAAACKGAKLDKNNRCRSTNGRFAKASCCAAAPSCDAAFVTAIEACVEEWQNDGDYDPYGEMEWDLYAQCADAEPMAPVRDQLCASGTQAFCALDPEAFATQYLPACAQQATKSWLDQSCVFGQYYRDLFSRSEAIVVLGRARLTASSSLTPLQEAQILSAVQATAHEPTTITEAFEVVDDNEVNYAEIWDASGRRAYTVYEVGAGDNSFGKIFVHGTTDAAATINDGDIYGCSTFWGPERRRCEADAQCTGGARCVGQSEVSKLGRCVNGALDGHPAEATFCSPSDADFGCPGGSGLACSGAALSGNGICLPAWMRGRFSTKPSQSIPDDSAAGTDVSLLAYGLATVDMDVRIDLHVSHPRPSDLRITLTNPADNEVLVFDGASSTASEIYLRGQALMGFSGDESVNGVWRLRVVDRVGGQSGTIEDFGLEIGSRWD